MKITKRSAVLLVLAFLLIVSIPVGVTLAIMHNRTEAVVNTFVPGVVDCEVTETFTQGVKTSVKVTNTGNTDAYLRIRVLSYWQDSKGNIVARPAELPSITYYGNPGTYDATKGDWIYDSNNATYYCVVPVAPGAATPELLKSSITMPDPVEVPGTQNGITVKYTYYPVIEFVAEAVQAEPDRAVEQSWNLNISDAAEGQANYNKIVQVFQ